VLRLATDYSSGVFPGSSSCKRIVIFCCAALALSGTAAATNPPIAGRDVLTGKNVALAQFRDKPVFVNVWGSWCGGCIAEAPTIARFARAHKSQVAFLGIDTEDSKNGARAYYRRFDTDYPSIWDPKGILAGAWSRGAPTTLVFDRKHRLVQRIEGSATLAQLNAALRHVARG
jgi:thiol-disulfide isomerase/thioredoxin